MRVLAGRKAIKLQLSAIELNRIERRPIQLILASQGHGLATSHGRWFDEQVDIAQRRLGGICNRGGGTRQKAISDLFKLMQRACIEYAIKDSRRVGQQEEEEQAAGSRQQLSVAPAAIPSKVKPTNCQQLAIATPPPACLLPACSLPPCLLPIIVRWNW